MPDNLNPDLLSQILAHYELRAEVFANPTVCGNWRVNTTGDHRAGFHLVCEGGCWFHSHGGEPQWLDAGDLVFLAREEWHVLAPEARIDDDTMHLVDDGDGPVTTLVCGAVAFDDPAGEAVLQTLPSPVVIAGDSATDAQVQRSLARILVAVSSPDHGGRQLLLDRLIEVLFVMVLRHIIATGQAHAGLLAGLRDRNMRAALQAIHADPTRRWQLEELAEHAGLARSTFARRFRTMIGQSPVHYLDHWRMWHAERLLTDHGRSVAQVAEALEYNSEAAFRRAFTRLRGRGPGQARRQARREHR